MDADVIVVGAGLAGLVATHELTSRGKRVLVVDQENAANLGGQAFWSFGGLFLVDSPEQRRSGVKDSFELAWNDWQGSAQFDRLDDEDSWAVRWARAYVEFAAGEKRACLDRPRHHLPADGRLGRTRRPARRRPRQLRAALPRRLGHRHRGRRTVRRLRPSSRRSAAWCTFYHRHRVDELVDRRRRRHRGARHRAGSRRRGPRRPVQPRARSASSS